MVAAGFIAAWLNLIAGLVLVVVGGLTAAWAYLRVRRRSTQAKRGMLVPLHPKVADVRLFERLRVRITLGSQGDYKTDPGPVEGTLTMVLVFGRPDHDRVRRHARQRPSTVTRDVRFSAGRLVLQGQVGIRAGPEVPGPILALDGSTETYTVFRAEDPPVSSSWDINLRYQLSADPDISAGPFWITPSVVPESDQRALELDVQWVKFGPDAKPLSLDVIELLQLRFPVSWGAVEQVSESVVLRSLPQEGSNQGLQSLEWQQLSPAEQEREVRRKTLTVRFENRIDPEDVLHGRLEATMKGTLSGVDGVRLYGSLGASRKYSPAASIKTRVEADFELSLASIRYQDIRVVPDRTAEDSDRGSYADEFDVIPDNETVIALTNAMSEGYYVKRVIENPPRSGGRADLVQRYWDIAGRKYEGVYPIDFHMILIGEEVHRGDIRPEAGTTKVRIVAKGAYTNDDMSNRVETVWNELSTLTRETLKGQASAGSGPAPD
jgi:hypothetical protein